MKASVLDLRRRTREILKALERNETVTILYRGKVKGILRPVPGREVKAGSAASHPAFGMWKDRRDLKDVARVVRDLRKGRSHAV